MIGSRARGALLGDPAVPGKRWEGCHDLTGPRALVCIAGELREREAARKARAARRSRSWLRKAGARLRDILRRGDRAPAGRPAPEAPRDLERRDPVAFEDAREPDLPSVYEALTNAQLTARRAGQKDLADAIHVLFLLDLTGNIAEVAPLVASVRASLQSALGDDPASVN